MARMTVVGLGSMGMGMAQSLVRAGHAVSGFDVAPGRAEALVAGGGVAATLAEAAAQSAVAVIVVLNAAQTETVLYGPEGIAPLMPKGGVIVSCATVSPEFARDMATRAEALGLMYLDAPISGGAARAASGELSIMASGSEAAFAAAKPALDAMAAVVHDLGREIGSGSAMKAVNQLLAGSQIALMGEALAFALSQGLDLRQVYSVITQSAGNSWMFQNRAPHVLDADYRPLSAVNIWLKDLGIVKDIATGAGVPVPLVDTALAQYRKAAEAGDGGLDDAAVTKVYTRAAGLKLPGEA
ncbi:MAG TPA: 3-hydroxyisobutyrate dehydrogenase [Rhodobacteraceae bacterium]|nr:3-hydroxyisobutyrate dehydrogenase [Paracoccaceae bacterium]HBV53622.1 3-hydroxyisobutyrate dehydrogenase [Paracoccaceae bacterium]